MSEGKFLSRKEKAKRIGSVSAFESTFTPDSCVPHTVAFTHGYSSEEYSLGLTPKAFVADVDSASNIVAVKHSEILTKRSFDVVDPSSVLKEINPIISNSRATWLTYFKGRVGHMLGVLREDDDKYLIYDDNNNERYEQMNSIQLVERIALEHTDKSRKSYIFGFQKT